MQLNFRSDHMHPHKLEQEDSKAKRLEGIVPPAASQIPPSGNNGSGDGGANAALSFSSPTPFSSSASPTPSSVQQLKEDDPKIAGQRQHREESSAQHDAQDTSTMEAVAQILQVFSPQAQSPPSKTSSKSKFDDNSANSLFGNLFGIGSSNNNNTNVSSNNSTINNSMPHASPSAPTQQARKSTTSVVKQEQEELQPISLHPPLHKHQGQQRSLPEAAGLHSSGGGVEIATEAPVHSAPSMAGLSYFHSTAPESSFLTPYDNAREITSSLTGRTSEAPTSAHKQFEPSQLPSGSNVSTTNSNGIDREFSRSGSTFSYSTAAPAAVTPPRPPVQPLQSPSAATFAPSSPSSGAASSYEDGVLAWMFGGSYTASPPPPLPLAQSSKVKFETAKANEAQQDTPKAFRGMFL